MSFIVLEPARLTDSGRPILQSGVEVELFLYEGVRFAAIYCPHSSLDGTIAYTDKIQWLLTQVDIQFQDQGGIPGQISHKYTGGRLVLTTHNVVWIDAAANPQPGRSCMLPLPAIKSAAVRASHMLAQSKLCMQITVDWQGRPQQDGALSVEVRISCTPYLFHTSATLL